MVDLSIGWQFDLAVVVIVLILVGAYTLWRMTFGRQTDQHLAEPQRPSFPQGTHEGDWDWPRHQESHRLRGS